MTQIKIPKSMISPLLQEKKYPSIGQCIYCGTTASKLSDEHVLPRGMNGYIIIKNASCEMCAREILKFEHPIMARQFGMLRQYLGYRSRKGSTYKAPVELFLKNGRRIRTKVLLDDHPLIFGYPKYIQRPTILEGVDYPAIYESRVISIRDKVETQLRVDRLCKKFGAVRLVSPMEYSLDMLSKLVCKVGHGLATIHFGLDNFQPLTIDYILGREDVYPGYYVGGSSGINSQSGSFSGLTMLTVERLGDRDVIIAHVGLFSEIGFPIYSAVIGFLRHWDEQVMLKAGFNYVLAPNDPDGRSFILNPKDAKAPITPNVA